ncbi:hypothetical protein GCM10027022_01790 [Alpinimonas psychrophila]|uniref:ESAT-6-like protein n=1 Tax=Alpinimonas psychrophila TaxID=748908 RepID=A0A7W3PNA1_9MICO|nr:WXG100 family type VII secretion target [Alpinimonas psychrophila]MBA8827988.1 WXG100 family type VII secretion target [Alpinimonas psychrophila]
MAIFRVDSDAVTSTTQSVQASIARIQAEVTGLHAQLTNLQSSWQGTASDAFQGVVGQWHLTARRVDESLAAINQALTLAANQYVEIEAANMRMFRG